MTSGFPQLPLFTNTAYLPGAPHSWLVPFHSYYSHSYLLLRCVVAIIVGSLSEFLINTFSTSVPNMSDRIPIDLFTAELESVGPKWYDLSMFLGITTHELESIMGVKELRDV